MNEILDLSAAHYHADAIGDTPTLSASIAHTICVRSPLHAWAAHPKLNPQTQRREESKFDVGTAAHAVILQGDHTKIRVIHAADWRTKAAKDEREVAREEGAVALLEHQWLAVNEMVDAVRSQIALLEVDPSPFTQGKAEQTIVWEDDHGVMCRARVDWLHDDRRTIDDLKTTSASANPERWVRTMFGIGGDIQAAFYRRGIYKLTGRAPDWRFVVVETYPPYAMSVVSLGPDVMALADRKVQHAIDVWADCLASDRWPAYPRQVAWAELPGYEERRWLEHEEVAA